MGRHLNAIDARALFSVRFAASGSWSVAFPAPNYLKFTAVRHGAAWVVSDGMEPQRIEAGDCLVVSAKAFRLCSDPTIKLVPASEVLASSSHDVVMGTGAILYYSAAASISIQSSAQYGPMPCPAFGD